MKIIAVCASVSFYQDLFAIEKRLKELGFKPVLPVTARRMKRKGSFDVESQKTWYKNPSDYHIKTALIKGHFKEIEKADAVLIVNNKKREMIGYIGGNTLMEMTIAFYLRKKIYILNSISDELSFAEEVYGMNPIFLNGDLGKIKK